MLATNSTQARRPRNPQGEGGRLREELIAAADRILAETGDEEGLSLRAVAREAGIATPSIYLHFANKEELVKAVMETRFAELGQAIMQAVAEPQGAANKLRAGCRAYCQFALDYPNAYRVLFGNRTSLRLNDPAEPLPGLTTFSILVQAIEGCIKAGEAQTTDAVRAATNVWAALHGIVSLRNAMSDFPWPPLEAQIEDLLKGLAGLSD